MTAGKQSVIRVGFHVFQIEFVYVERDERSEAWLLWML